MESWNVRKAQPIRYYAFRRPNRRHHAYSTHLTLAEEVNTFDVLLQSFGKLDSHIVCDLKCNNPTPFIQISPATLN